ASSGGCVVAAERVIAHLARPDGRARDSTEPRVGICGPVHGDPEAKVRRPVVGGDPCRPGNAEFAGAPAHFATAGGKRDPARNWKAQRQRLRGDLCASTGRWTTD